MIRKLLRKLRIERCQGCDDIRDWNEAADVSDPVDKYYGDALQLLHNRREKTEIATLIAKLLRENAQLRKKK